MSDNLYGGKIVYYEAGRFGRCRHGYCRGMVCLRCGIFHPIKFIKSWLREKS